ncbi:hypothetical protein [Desulfuromonas acetoxidans]|uniref:hypothetical protein n=1 Tax=Desulfuromonas acetoxidans TaxID=891 RepID=UPI00292F6725|nr:hypothetical protein [Desulfuromonas acetoxidans]
MTNIDKESVLREALDRAKAALDVKVTRNTISAFNAATEALDAFLSSPGEVTPIGFLEIKSEAAAVSYLNGQGFKIGKSKFNADVNQRLVAKKDGGFCAADLDDYALAADLPRLDAEADRQATSISDGVKAEQQRALKFKNDLAEGLYTLTADIEKMLSSRAAVLKAGNEQFWRDNAAEIIRRVDDGMTAAELIEFGLELTDEHFDQYARENS